MGNNLQSINYDDSSIKESKGPETLRKRPATLLGSSNEKGSNHATFEIISNSIDEARQGFGNKINVTVEEDYTVTVEDFGRGVPMAWNPDENKWNYELVFCTLYASGKGKGGAYSSSEGLNGIGCTAAQYTSDFMDVISHREVSPGVLKEYEMHFKDGWPVGKLIERPYDGPTGTKIRFRPSLKVFTSTKISFDGFADRLRKKIMTVKGVELNFTYCKENPIRFYFEKGILDFVERAVLEPINKSVIEITAVRDSCNDSMGAYDPTKTYTAELNLCLSFSRETSIEEMYHNGAVLSSGGATRDAVYDALLKVFNKVCLDRNKIQKGDKILLKDFAELVSVVGETRCPGEFSLFEHQTKSALENPSIALLIKDSINTQFTAWLGEHKRESDEIIAEVITNKELREKLSTVKTTFLRKMTSNIHKAGQAPEKFLDCDAKDPKQCEVYMMEGESSKGVLTEARDSRYQAIMPLKGKIINLLKKSLESVVRPGVVADLVQVLGCGIELKSKYIKDMPQLEFSMSKLNFHKIIICTDADVDGGHITCLLLIFFYRLMPTLLKEGCIYLALSPLYMIKYKADKVDKTYYAYNDAEKDRALSILKSNGVEKYTVRRFKGLGESNAEILSETVMNKATRNLVQITYPENEEELRKTCEALLGDDLETRKALVQAYFNSVTAVFE